MDIQTAPLLDTREAARYLGLSTSFLTKVRIYSPELSPPFVRIGRAVRYPRAALDGFIAARSEGGR